MDFSKSEVETTNYSGTFLSLSAQKTLEAVDQYGVIDQLFPPIHNSSFRQCMPINRDLLVHMFPHSHDRKFGDYQTKAHVKDNEILFDLTWPDISRPDKKTRLTETVIKIGFSPEDGMPLYLESTLYNPDEVTYFVTDADRFVGSFHIRKEQLESIYTSTYNGDKNWWKYITRKEVNAWNDRIGIQSDTLEPTHLVTQLKCAEINANTYADFLPSYVALAYTAALDTHNPELIDHERRYLLQMITDSNSESICIEKIAAVEALVRIDEPNAHHYAEYEAAIHAVMEGISADYSLINTFQRAHSIIIGLRNLGKTTPKIGEFISNFFTLGVHKLEPINGHFLLFSLMGGIIIDDPQDDSISLYKKYLDEYLHSAVGQVRTFDQISEFSKHSAFALLRYLNEIDTEHCTDIEYLIYHTVVNAWAAHIAGIQCEGFGIRHATAINAMREATTSLEQYPIAQRYIARRFATTVAQTLGSNFENLIILQERAVQINLIATHLFPAVNVGYFGSDIFFSHHLLLETATVIGAKMLQLFTRTCTSIYDDNIIYHPQLVIDQLRNILISLTNGLADQFGFIETLKEKIRHEAGISFVNAGAQAIAAEFLETCITHA